MVGEGCNYTIHLSFRCWPPLRPPGRVQHDPLAGKRMNILIVHPCKGFYGGAEEVVVQLCEYLRKQKHVVQLITKNAPQEVSWSANGAYDVSNWVEFCRGVGSFSDWADVICAFNFPATLATLLKKTPIVWYCNEPPELFTSSLRKPVEALNRWWVKKSRMTVVVADLPNFRRFRHLYGVSPRVVPYGVDYEFWSQEERRDWHSIDGLRLLQVGTVSPYKNQMASVVALAQLKAEGVQAVLNLIGGVSDEAYYERLVEYAECNKLHVQEGQEEADITFLGQMSQEETRYLYNNHHVLLHPVRGQGGWLVPFEAMCAGLPVVTIPRLSASEVIRHNKLGIVSQDMARSLLLKEHLGLNTETIRSWVRENLTWEQFGDKMTKIFREVTGGLYP